MHSNLKIIYQIANLYVFTGPALPGDILRYYVALWHNIFIIIHFEPIEFAFWTENKESMDRIFHCLIQRQRARTQY